MSASQSLMSMGAATSAPAPSRGANAARPAGGGAKAKPGGFDDALHGAAQDQPSAGSKPAEPDQPHGGEPQDAASAKPSDGQETAADKTGGAADKPAEKPPQAPQIANAAAMVVSIIAPLVAPPPPAVETAAGAPPPKAPPQPAVGAEAVPKWLADLMVKAGAPAMNLKAAVQAAAQPADRAKAPDNAAIPRQIVPARTAAAGAPKAAAQAADAVKMAAGANVIPLTVEQRPTRLAAGQPQTVETPPETPAVIPAVRQTDGNSRRGESQERRNPPPQQSVEPPRTGRTAASVQSAAPASRPIGAEPAAVKAISENPAPAGDKPAQPQAGPAAGVTVVVQNRQEPAAARTPHAPPAGPPADAYDIKGQLVEQMRLIKGASDTQQMIIKLKPEHLGQLTLKIAVDNGVVNATFHSDNAQVRTVLENSLIQLRQELSAQGVKIDQVGVYAGLGQFLANDQRQDAQQGRRAKPGGGRRADLETYEEKAAAPGMTNAAAAADGVDYRI